jgi:hypothetical protein
MFSFFFFLVFCFDSPVGNSYPISGETKEEIPARQARQYKYTHINNVMKREMMLMVDVLYPGSDYML